MRRPTRQEVIELARQEHMIFTEEQADLWADVLDGLLRSAEALEEIPLPLHEMKWGRRESGYVPDLSEDPFNVFTQKCRIEGDTSGPLAGRTFAVKDNIAVAGLQTTNGSRSYSYTPHIDAVVVERLLSAGAVMVGKLNMDDFASHPTGESSYFGPARNPYDPDYSAGGSSGGSGAAVAANECDFALGVDQGGSGRVPASYCGVVAIKATHGLIPTHGLTHVDHTIDYITPTARSVGEVAAVLDVIAGTDSRDPQWARGNSQRQQYSDLGPVEMRSLRIGVVSESIDDNVCDPAVLTNFRQTLDLARDAGAIVEEVPVPMWSQGWAICGLLLIHLGGNMMKSEGAGYGHLGPIDEQAVHAFALSRRVEADSFAPMVKTWLIAERLLREKYLNLSYARAHNLRLHFRRQLSDLLGRFDLLLTPTTPTTAPKLAVGVQEDTSLMGRVPTALHNTCPLNLSGHPAVSLPNGFDSAGLPTSLQVIGKHFDERLVIGVSMALEAELTAGQ